MTAKGKQQDAVRKFLKEAADIALKELEEKFLQVARCLRDKRDVRAADLKAMAGVVRTLNAAARAAGLKKTADLTRHWEALLEYTRERSIPLDRKLADLLGAALEALESLTKDLTQRGEELTDVSRAIADIKKITEKDAGKKKKVATEGAAEADEAYLGVYLDETEQNVAHFNDDLVILEKNPDDPALINNLFRVIHTIKGSSAMMNIADVQRIAHAMENILVIARDNRQASAEMFPFLFSGIDTISNVISSLRQKKEVSADTASLIEKLKGYAQSFPPEMRRKEDLPEMAAVSRAARETLTQVLARQERVYRIMVALEENTPLKGMKASLIEEHLNTKGVVIVMHPKAEDIHDLRQGAVTIGVLFGTAAGAPEIQGVLGIAGVRVISLEPVPSKDLAELLEKKAILVPSEAEQRAVEDKKTGLPAKKISALAPSLGSSALTPFIRIDAQKLDTLMNLSGELVTLRAQYEGLVNQMRGEVSNAKEFARILVRLKSDFLTLLREFNRWSVPPENAPAKYILKEFEVVQEHLEHLERAAGQSRLATGVRHIDETTGAFGKVVSHIQAAVMQARMVPIRGVFSRFTRIVRDLAKELGKDVTLVLEGEETELDRNLIDGIAEPLIHMVRNAIDHGIEDTHTRRNAGKPERGTITLRAFHQGNNMCIEVKDDGKGLNGQLLAENALKKKLVTEDQVQRLTEREKWDLIFLPGSSTAARVTSLSGRGVGMDAVRSLITAMNGTIDIQSEVGRGTTFIFNIPLTLAIIQALLVGIADQIYALPLESVMEIMSVIPEMIDARGGHATVLLREHSIRLMNLQDVLHIRSRGDPGNGTRRVAVISDGERQAGVFVDKFVKETEIVIKALPHQFSRVSGISGVTILGDGRVALILDPKTILQTT